MIMKSAPTIDLMRLVDETRSLIEPFCKKRDVALLEDIECIETSDPDYLCKNPLLTVSVLAYNQENYIRECLDSILMQEVDFQYEILIGEDCSNDATRTICFEYQRRHPDKIRVLWSKSNVGLIANGLRVAARKRGRYSCGIGGDDFFCSRDKLSKQVRYLETHLDCAMVYCGAKQQLEGWKVTRGASSRKSDAWRRGINALSRIDKARKMLRTNFVTACTPMGRQNPTLRVKMKRLEAKVGWVPSEDFVYWFYTLCEGDIHYIGGDKAVYRINSKSLSGNANQSVALVRILGDWRVRAVLADECEFLDDDERLQVAAGLVSALCDYYAYVVPSGKLPDYCAWVLAGNPQAFAGQYQPCITGDFTLVRRKLKIRRIKWHFSHMMLGFLIKRIAVKLFNI